MDSAEFQIGQLLRAAIKSLERIVMSNLKSYCANARAVALAASEAIVTTTRCKYIHYRAAM